MKVITQGAYVMVVEDHRTTREMLIEDLSGHGYEAQGLESFGEAWSQIQERAPDAVILDLRLGTQSGMDLLRKIRGEFADVGVIMITGHGGVEDAEEAGQLGCYNFFLKPFNMAAVRACLAGMLAESARRQGTERELEDLREARASYAGHPLIGQSGTLKKVLETVARVARSPSATVLVRGETGAGKELIARRIHAMSSRAQEPFVELNCSAIPENLLESELFGHERGAFTDARRQKKGIFELASGGTVFLDEIGEMSPSLQAKLLKVIDEKCFRRLGGLTEMRVDTRVIAATHRDLAQLVQDGKFREDLYHRLNVVPVFLPPLRERAEDIPLLVSHFAKRFAGELGKPEPRLLPETEQRLRAYPWPGNVRELRNVVERILLLEEDDTIRVEHLPPEILAPGSGASAAPEMALRGDRVLPLSEIERQAILLALERTGGNKTRAASQLGISRQTLRTKLKEYALESGEDDDGEE
ncbi:MAG TPA: sigma-54 dependent transcriptional regulator [Candidatus Eisenbacteria bacterium]|nr:sigma-54 dependent transcriptional regulator [Candidatus Eisenbacteria bacterium]